MIVRIAALVAAQLALVGGAVAPQLVSRAAGADYRLRVQPVDPVDPFRGAYVALSYPDLQPGRHSEPAHDGRDVYLTLVERGGVWVAGERAHSRPDAGPYLACTERSWEVRCGIESYFVPQDRASDLERGLRDGGVAVVRVDARGVGTVMSVEPE